MIATAAKTLHGAAQAVARSLRLGAASVALAGVAACGGGELLLALIPGVGTGGTGIVAGVITGLGSIIVDGERYDESSAELVQQVELGTDAALTAADFQVGQYVQLELGADGKPARVQLEAQIVGPIAHIDPAQGRLRVLGQAIVINASAGAGPVTLFVGASGIGDLREGDVVRIYGTLRASPAGADMEQLLASRVEHLGSQVPTQARLTGTLRIDTAQAWLIGTQRVNLASTRWLPSGTLAQEGLAVTAVADWAQVQGMAYGGTGALEIKAARPLVQTPATGSQRLSGPVRLVGDGQIEVQGVRIRATAAGPAAALAGLTEGTYVVVQTQGDGAGGQAATQIDRQPGGGRTSELRGTVDSRVGATQFRVRGVVVDAATAEFAGGTAASLANGSFVLVQGELTAAGLRAQRVELLGEPPVNAVVQLTGTVQAVAENARTFVLMAPTGQLQTVALPDESQPPKPGDTLDLLGYWSGQQVLARAFEVRPALEPDTLELRGVLEILPEGRLRVNGQTLQASAEQVLAVQALRGREVRLKVRRTGAGLLQLIEIVQGQPQRKP